MQYRNSGYIEDWFDSYLYRKNLQGDVIGVYNESGALLVSYTYDAWGNQTVTYSNGGASTAARYNPFRYRGYMIILAFTHYHPGVDDGTLSFSGDDNEVASGLEVIQYIVNTAGVIREDRNYLPSWKYDFLG